MHAFNGPEKEKNFVADPIRTGKNPEFLACRSEIITPKSNRVQCHESNSLGLEVYIIFTKKKKNKPAIFSP
jgi:hypothetical protein